jgi:predicted RNA binding protein YcfA (HicA-like mRNA interferase family)
MLEEHGWPVGKPGRHVVKMVKEGERPITLPRHRGAVYGKGLTRAIIKQANLDSTEDKGWGSRSSYIGSRTASGRRSTSYRDVASGRTLGELTEALEEALGLYLGDDPVALGGAPLRVGRVTVAVDRLSGEGA